MNQVDVKRTQKTGPRGWLGGEPKIDRLLLEIAQDPILSSVIKRCKRPYFGHFVNPMDYTSRWLNLIVPCPDRETADFLQSCPSWDWHWIPFDGTGARLIFAFPGGEFHLSPKDPRVKAFQAAIIPMLSPEVTTDVYVEYTPFDWLDHKSGHVFGIQEREPDHFEPYLGVNCSRLDVFNELMGLSSMFLRLIDTLMPSELNRFCIGLFGHDGITGFESFCTEWLPSPDGWQLQEADSLTPYALALLDAAGLEWPIHSIDHEWCFVGLQVEICDDCTLHISGTHEAVKACLPLLEPIREQVQQLCYLPPIATLERVEFELGGETISHPLQPGVEIVGCDRDSAALLVTTRGSAR